MKAFLIFWWQEIINFSLLILSLAIFFYKRLFLRSKFIAIGLFLFINLLIEIFATYLTARETNNLFLYYLLTPVQLIIILYQFALLLAPNVKSTVFFIIGLIGLILMLYFTLTESLSVYPSNSILIRNLVYCLLSLIYFKTLLGAEELIDIQKEPMFWFVSGILIFSFSGVIIDGSMKFILRYNRNIANQLFLVWLVLNYIFYLFIIGSFTLERRWKT